VEVWGRRKRRRRILQRDLGMGVEDKSGRGVGKGCMGKGCMLLCKLFAGRGWYGLGAVFGDCLAILVVHVV